MADNVMGRLRCQTTAHGPMERRLADRQPYAGPYSVWVCLTCGMLAVHLEWCGDIHWYQAIPVQLEGDPREMMAVAERAQREWDETPEVNRPAVEEDLPW